MAIQNSFKEELKQKCDIVSIISRYVQLEKKGKTYWGLCPFHGEKTPSFAVNESDQFFHCFGCKESGDVFAFIEKIENCSFSEAVNILAEIAGVKVPEPESKKDQEEALKNKVCLNALKDTAIYYHDCLNSELGTVARDYLKSRNVPVSIQRIFGLGYCPDYENTRIKLNEMGYSDNILLEAGILKKGAKGLYDPMGFRLVFPVFNLYGEVVAYTGRTLKKNSKFAKYLNTSETKIYSKRKNLYAINLVRKYIKQEKFDYLIIVEGNMDVIALNKAGFRNVIAGMGTALTIEQAKLIKRFVNKVYICYDGDFAGKKATLAGLQILKDQGLDIMVMSLPNGKDPDDVIQEGGKDAFDKLINEAYPLIEYRIRDVANKYNLNSYDEKSKFINEAIEILNDLSNEIEKDTYLSLIQNLSGANKDFLRRQINSNIQPVDKFVCKKEEMSDVKKEKIDLAEKFLLNIIYHKHCSAQLSEAKSKIKYFYDIFSEKAKQILIELENKSSVSQLVETFINDKDIIGEIVVAEPPKDYEKVFWDCIKKLQNSYLSKEQAKLTEAIDKEVDRNTRNELLNKLQELTKERNLYKL